MALSSLGVRESQTSPKFLHTNSTSHTWIFSAIAELVDNAYDPDVNATILSIDHKEIGSQVCLTFTDNGQGCPPDRIHKMLSFGYCEKIAIKDHKPIGHYGNGFKSGSMRLGKDAVVFSKHGKHMSVGLLSQTFLQEVNAESILVPIVSWDKRTYQVVEAPDAVGSLHAILKYSLFTTEEDLFQEFNVIERSSGMRIIIYNLTKGSDGHHELDLKSDKYDIINSEHQELDFAGGLMSRPIRGDRPEYRRSLREYLSMLFLKPRMKITLCGKRVKTKLIRKSLSKTRRTSYTPSFMLNQGKKGVEIIFGFGQKNQEYGMMMYYKNRLIKAYERVGCQKQPNDQGVGVVGVVELDYLEPVHNKQDFLKTDRYNAVISALGIKLGQYWNSVTGQEDISRQYLERPDWTWVQCDKCMKWRRMPDAFANRDLPEKWYCFLNPDMSHNRCDIDEEPEDEDEVYRITVNRNKSTKGKDVRPPPMIHDTFGSSMDAVQSAHGPVATIVTPGGSTIIQAANRPVQTKGKVLTVRLPTRPPARQATGAVINIRPSTSNATGATANIKEENSENSTNQSSVSSDLKKNAGKKRASSDKQSPVKAKKTKKTPKKYTETTNDEGDMVVVLTSSDESDSSDDEVTRPDSPDEDKPDVTQLDEQISHSAAEADASSESEESDQSEHSKSDADYWQRKWKKTTEQLKTLRCNVRELLKVLVPDISLESSEMVDKVVLGMVNVSAEQDREKNKNPVENGQDEDSSSATTTEPTENATTSTPKPTTPTKSEQEPKNSTKASEKQPTDPKKAAADTNIVSEKQPPYTTKPATITNQPATNTSPSKSAVSSTPAAVTNKTKSVTVPKSEEEQANNVKTQKQKLAEKEDKSVITIIGDNEFEQPTKTINGKTSAPKSPQKEKVRKPGIIDKTYVPVKIPVIEKINEVIDLDDYDD